ncbi:MAG: DUF5320 domain-containing protein [Parcubacteria group bacterium]
MPGFDGTGPVGQGPMTGRGMGPCDRSLRQGRRCWGYGFRRFFSPKNNLSTLEAEEKALEEELKIVREEKAALEDQN